MGESKDLVIKEPSKFIAETTSFALKDFNSTLSIQQQKLYYWTVSMVKKDEDPETQAVYKVSISDMAKAMGIVTRSLRRNMKNTVAKLQEMNLRLTSTDMSDNGDINVSFGIFQSISMKKEEPDEISIRLMYDFRKKVIQMKSVHDIEYPTQTILNLKSKYSIPLYVYIIAAISLEREKGNYPPNGCYVIVVPKAELIRVMHYESGIKKFNSQTLPTVLRDLIEHSELIFNSDDPEKIRASNNVITDYVFHVRVNTSISKPIFTNRRLAIGMGEDIPDMEYLQSKLAEMGVSESLRKRIRLDNKPRRVWGNLLYTWYFVGNSARYFNVAYHEDYLGDRDIPSLLIALVSEKPEYLRDDMIRELDIEYSRNGMEADKTFIEELLEHFKKKS